MQIVRGTLVILLATVIIAVTGFASSSSFSKRGLSDTRYASFMLPTPSPSPEPYKEHTNCESSGEQYLNDDWSEKKSVAFPSGEVQCWVEYYQEWCEPQVCVDTYSDGSMEEYSETKCEEIYIGATGCEMFPMA